MIRQELRRLKGEDTNENFENQKRINVEIFQFYLLIHQKIKKKKDYRLQLLMEKEKMNQEKLKMMKSEQEILKKTRSFKSQINHF